MEELRRPSGIFKISLRKSENPQMRSPWVYVVVSPSEEKFQGSARSRRKADSAIRKIIAREEAALLEIQKGQQRQAVIIRDLRRCGIDEYTAKQLSEKDSLRYRELSPGQILCSYKSGWQGERLKWHSQIFLQGQKISFSNPHQTRYMSERQALAGLQKFYEQEALEDI